jgi:VWFA-related protein
MVKQLAICVLTVMFLASGFVCAAQSRRVRPAPPAEPVQKRPSPTPTPTPEPVDDAPDTGETLEVETRLVTVPVRVLDRKNRFIGGLRKENFSIYENGAQQEIAYFTNEAQPFVVALVLDMSYSTVFKINEIQQAAIAFIDQLRPNDKVMVVAFDEEVHMLCEPTTDRRQIYAAINSTRIATGTSLYEAVDLTMNARLRSIEGRKAIVLFTDGVDTTSRRSNDLRNLGDAMELDALIYPVRYDTYADVQNMKGRTTIGFPGSGTSGPGTVPTTPPIGGGSPPTAQTRYPSPTGPTVMTSPNDKGTTAAEYAYAEEYLNQLALRTGGRVYLASTFGNLNGAFAKIASELREFYSIGYYPAADGKPGESRKVKVRVDQPNVAVKARDSYTVPGRKKF